MFGLEVLSMFGLATGNLANASKNNAAQKGMANGMQFQAALSGLNANGMQPNTLMLQNGQSIASSNAATPASPVPSVSSTSNANALNLEGGNASKGVNDALKVAGVENALSGLTKANGVSGANNNVGFDKVSDLAAITPTQGANNAALNNTQAITNNSMPHSFDGIPVVTNANVKPEHQNGLMLGMIISNGATMENSPAVLTLAQFASLQAEQGNLLPQAQGLSIATKTPNDGALNGLADAKDGSEQAGLLGLIVVNFEELAHNLNTLAPNSGDQKISQKDSNAIFAAETQSNNALQQAFVALGNAQLAGLSAKQAITNNNQNALTGSQAQGVGLFKNLGQPIVLLPNNALANNKAVVNAHISAKPLSIATANPQMVQKVVAEMNVAGGETSPLLKGMPNLSNVILGNVTQANISQGKVAPTEANGQQPGQMVANSNNANNGAAATTNASTKQEGAPLAGGFNQVTLPEKIAGKAGDHNPILIAQNGDMTQGTEDSSLPFAVTANKAAIFGQSKAGQAGNKADGASNPAGMVTNNSSVSQANVAQAMNNASGQGQQNASGQGLDPAMAAQSDNLASDSFAVDDANAAFEKLLMKNTLRHGNERMGLESANGLKVAGGFDAAGSGFGTGQAVQGDGALIQMSTASAAEVATGSSSASFHDISVANQTGRVASSFLASQVGLKIGHAIKADNREFSIRLDPPEMGRIDVKLAIDKSGQVKALISVENKETLAMLQRDSGVLERTLQDAGVKTDQNSLNFNLKEENSSHGQERYQERQNQKQAEADLDDFEDDVLSNEDITEAVLRTMNLDQGLDIKV